MNRVYFNRIMKIAIPIILSNVISQLQMIIDRIFLGQMNTLYMSALGNVTSPMWTTMSFAFTITAGTSILISQNVGAGNKDKANEFAASLLKWNNIPSIALFLFWLFCGKQVFHMMGVSDSVMPFCLGYLKYYVPSFLLIGIEGSTSVIMQTSNYTKPMVFYGIIRSGFNVVLDYALIFGHWGLPALGIEGAALATTIAEFTGVIFATYAMRSKELTTRPPVKDILKAPVAPYLTSLKLGVNCALEDLAWNAGNLVIIRILNSINELAAGIYSIVFGVEVLVVVVIASFGNATMILTGEAKGKKDKDQFKQVVKLAYMLSAIVAFVVLVICIAFPKQILGLFSSDEQIITGCGIYLTMVCINLFGKSGNIIVGSGIKGNGDTKWMLCTQIFGTVLVVSCACTFVYVMKLGIIGVFMAVIVDEGIRALINLGKFMQITGHSGISFKEHNSIYRCFGRKIEKQKGC